jgi:lysophospholipase L1-like esterase
MLALVAGVESFVARHALEYTGPGPWSWQVAGDAARREAPGRQILCFGDSLMKLGIAPPVVSRRSGRSSYNLAIFAAQAPATYFMLRRALGAGARPEAVVVDFAPDLLSGGPRYNMRQWGEFLNLDEAVDLARHARDAAFFAEAMLGRLLPTVRARSEIRTNIHAALLDSRFSLRSQTLPHWRNWGLNAGGELTPADHDPIRPLRPEDAARLHSGTFWCDPINRHYLDRFLSLAAARRIRVYWLLTPVTPEMQRERDRTGADARFSRFVASWQERCPGLVVLDGRRSGYGTGLFVDPIHLDARGAAALSDDVAGVLAARGLREDRRWVALPRYRARPADPTLEDLDRSRVALGFPGERRM